MLVFKHRIELVDEILPVVNDRRRFSEFRHPPRTGGVAQERCGEKYSGLVRLIAVGLSEKMLDALRNEDWKLSCILPTKNVWFLKLWSLVGILHRIVDVVGDWLARLTRRSWWTWQTWRQRWRWWWCTRVRCRWRRWRRSNVARRRRRRRL